MFSKKKLVCIVKCNHVGPEIKCIVIAIIVTLSLYTENNIVLIKRKFQIIQVCA